MTVDVAVVGAGPAGSIAALRARRLAPDARVLLLDRSEFPRDKACGDGIGPEGVALLEAFGIGDVLDGYPPVPTVRVTGPYGVEVVGRPRRPGHVVPRAVLDARLRAAAIAAGVEAVTHRVRSLEQRDDGVVLDGAVHARVVIAADGANSTVRRLVGLRRVPASRTGLAIRGYVEDDDWADLWIGFRPDPWPSYAWAFPTGTGLVNVGFGPFDATLVSRRAELSEGLRQALPAPLGSPRELRAHHLPLSNGWAPLAHRRVLFVGDAAALINPLTGEGIAAGMLSGALAGWAAAVAPGRAAAAYRSALRRGLGRHRRHTALAAAVVRRRPTAVERAVRAARDAPQVFDDLCDVALGSGPLTGTMLRQLAATLATPSVRRGDRVVPSPSGRVRG